jgi:hypothetical protein
MKIASLILTLPVLAFGQYSSEKNILTFSDQQEEALSYIEQGSPLDNDFDHSDSLSLFEINEEDESLILWVPEGLATEEFIELFDQKSDPVCERFEDVFTYEMPGYGEGMHWMPTYEKIAEEKRRLFNRPKVIESTPQSQSSKKDLAKKEVERRLKS